MEDLKKDLQDIGQDVKLIVTKVHTIEIETAVNTKSLEEHMRRTEASENRIVKIEDRMFKEKLMHGGLMAGTMAIVELIRRFI